MIFQEKNTFISIRSWGGTDLAFDFALYHPPFPSPDLVCNANRREFAKHARSSCSGQCLRTRSIIANARTKCKFIMLPMRVRKTLACIRGAFEVISMLINIYNGNTVWSLMTVSSEPFKILNSDLNRCVGIFGLHVILIPSYFCLTALCWMNSLATKK